MTDRTAGGSDSTSSGIQVTALVPMRHASARIPGKNYRELAGKPLYTYILETLSHLPVIHEILVDTDSPIIRDGVAQRFPHVRLLERPHDLRGGDVPMNEILLYDVNEVESAYFLQTHSTNPLLSPATITRAIDTFMGVIPGHDSLFGVTRIQARLWDRDAKPLNHDPEVLIPTQDLDPIYLENSCLYVFSKDGLLSRRNRIGERPYLFEIDEVEAIDIDTEVQFQLAEELIRRRREV